MEERIDGLDFWEEHLLEDGVYYGIYLVMG